MKPIMKERFLQVGDLAEGKSNKVVSTQMTELGLTISGPDSTTATAKLALQRMLLMRRLSTSYYEMPPVGFSRESPLLHSRYLTL